MTDVEQSRLASDEDDNPYVKSPRPGALGEIYAYGCRNPQRFSWAQERHMFLADIGQEVVQR
jgi:glucose/arabinose dehydrogenase